MAIVFDHRAQECFSEIHITATIRESNEIKTKLQRVRAFFEFHVTERLRTSSFQALRVSFRLRQNGGAKERWWTGLEILWKCRNCGSVWVCQAISAKELQKSKLCQIGIPGVFPSDLSSLSETHGLLAWPFILCLTKLLFLKLVCPSRATNKQISGHTDSAAFAVPGGMWNVLIVFELVVALHG